MVPEILFVSLSSFGHDAITQRGPAEGPGRLVIGLHAWPRRGGKAVASVSSARPGPVDRISKLPAIEEASVSAAFKRKGRTILVIKIRNGGEASHPLSRD